ncbi:hemocyte protein-glutamine gamma-glutamyltransferase-like isoform X3 [Leptotrombidium deliense]|uniref:Hemocyte protein-glutamine gamma-glutamyltransferase-like isoform X3 n=1 Tax=Leptotrombidium deliense TaxID=299467 RepID=A0A443S8Y4_9ACAR|nr:hemocyte protein-glutamine gamma-glutamyltransferase-like isoform X3 [Leptotrombidium deliense]
MGDIRPPFDTNFVYSEVNADCYYYAWNSGSDRYEIAMVNTERIGKLIITKKIGPISEVIDYEDITGNYKFKEGSVDERNANLKAMKTIGRIPMEILKKRSQIQEFELKAEIPNSIMIGDAINIQTEIINRITSNLTVEMYVNISSMYYNDKIANEILNFKESIHLNEKGKQKINFTIAASDYLDKLVGHSTIRVQIFTSLNNVLNNRKIQNDINIEKPELRIEAKPVVSLGEKFNLNISLFNPLLIVVQNCKLNIESNHFGPKELNIQQIEALSKFNTSIPVIIRKPGIETFEANLNCEILTNIASQITVLVKGNSMSSSNIRPPMP